MITHRQLTINDHDQLLDLFTQRPELFNGYTDDQYKNQLPTLIPKMLINPLWFNLGIFVDGYLQGAGLMKELTTAPAWAWAHWVIRKGSMSYLATEEGLKTLRNLDQELFDEMENNRKLNRIFLAYRAEDASLRSIGSFERIIRSINRQGATRISRYQFVVDCIVEPNTLPKYEYQRSLLLNRPWPIRTGVCMGVLQSN
jgi:hypothetical protein